MSLQPIQPGCWTLESSTPTPSTPASSSLTPSSLKVSKLDPLAFHREITTTTASRVPTRERAIAPAPRSIPTPTPTEMYRQNLHESIKNILIDNPSPKTIEELASSIVESNEYQYIQYHPLAKEVPVNLHSKLNVFYLHLEMKKIKKLSQSNPPITPITPAPESFNSLENEAINALSELSMTSSASGKKRKADEIEDFFSLPPIAFIEFPFPDRKSDRKSPIILPFDSPTYSEA